jgi:LuxR family maltose regulon positive regulatory protein
MPLTITLTKTRIRPPHRGAGLVSRKTLDEVAERIPQSRLVFVKAPAGYGKSSQLYRWHTRISESGAAVGWLSLDRSIDDLRTLFFYITEAIRELAPDFGAQFLSFLESSHDPTVNRVASAFVNELADVSHPIFLFIDDLHLLADSDAKKALEIVLRDAPGNFHLVIASRQSAPFSLARLRVLGKIEEIDVQQLKFDEETTNAFVELSGRPPLPNDKLKQLVAATEGWAAGVQLATISIFQHGGATHIFDRISGENRVVADYLLDDVIEHLPDETINFLLKTSILEFFSEELCDHVTGHRNSAAQIRDLAARSLFIFSLDEEQNWFRYHHLFSELLRRMLRKRMPEEIIGLHRRASEWFSAHQNADFAFAHAVKAEDWLAAARILDSSCNNLFYGGKLSTLIQRSNALPAEILVNFPRLQLEIAWSIILEWRFDEARTIIRDIEVRLQKWNADGVNAESIEDISRIVLHRKMMLALFSDDMPTVEKYVLELMHDFPSEDPYLRGTLENCLIHARREMFRLDNVDKMDRRGREFFRQSGSKFVLVWHESILAPTYHLRGDADLAESALLSAIEIAEYVDGPCTPLQAMPAILLAEVKYELNDVDAAQALIDRFGRYADKQGLVDHLAAYFVTRSRLARRLGQFDEAARIIMEGHAFAEFRGFPRLAHRLDYESVQLAALSGELSILEATVKCAAGETERRRLSPGSHSLSQDEPFVLGWRLASCHVGNARETVAVMKKWVSYAANRGALRSEIRFRIGLALSLFAAGENGEALRTMRTAVQKAAKPRFIRSFVDAGAPALTMLEKLFDYVGVGADPVEVFGAELLQVFTNEPLHRTDERASHAPQIPSAEELAPPDCLSEREHEILRLVALEKSNKEIACTLGMTEGTVKWYMQQVFMKMDVRRRSHAVRRARQFGLI